MEMVSVNQGLFNGSTQHFNKKKSFIKKITLNENGTLV